MRGLGSVVKRLIVNPGVASSISLTPTKVTLERDKNFVFPSQMTSCISAIHWARLRTWFSFVVGVPTSFTLGH